MKIWGTIFKGVLPFLVPHALTLIGVPLAIFRKMKRLFLILGITLILSCSRNIYYTTQPLEIEMFDLWVKNPNTFECEIFYNYYYIGIVEPVTHQKIARFNKPDSLFLKAVYQSIVVIEKKISTEYWRKASYTFHLPRVHIAIEDSCKLH